MPEENLLSVIIPAYNEEVNFASKKLDQVYQYLISRNKPFELILADDGSTDRTLEFLGQFISEKREVKVLKLEHAGKALTVKTGMLRAKGKYRLFTDFDQSTPITELENLVYWIDQGYDLVIGSRELSGAERKNEPWYRHVMGRGFNWIVRMLAVGGIQDTQCGFKMMTGRATDMLFPRLKVTVQPKKDAFTGAMDVELLFLAKVKGLRVKEVPVRWKHVTSARVSPFKDSVRMLIEVIKIRLMGVSGKYAK